MQFLARGEVERREKEIRNWKYRKREKGNYIRQHLDNWKLERLKE